VHQGFAGWPAPAFDGVQFLDLDGSSAGAISQTFSTTSGDHYTFSIAYANNPFNNGASATVKVFDTATNSVLFTESVSHGTSTTSNYDWTQSGPLSFTTTGTSTTLSFTSNDNPGSIAGVLLDAISTNAITTAVPEPSTLTLSLVAGVLGALGYAWRRRKRAA
jgi:hypothetical protein